MDVSVLFVQKESIYYSLPVDCWDILRDARNYTGPNPVVCHPPCRAWGRLKAFAKPRPDEKELAVKAVDFVRLYGGVLEHPSGSSLWRELNLPLGNCADQYGGFTISVNQSWFGHQAQKKTLLYICGICRSQVPQLPLSFNAIEYTVGGSSKNNRAAHKKNISKKKREATPLAFALWLVQLASLCRSN